MHLLTAAVMMAGVAGAGVSHRKATAEQPGARQPLQQQVADARTVAADVRTIIGQNYVLPAVRAKLVAALDDALATGRYDTADPTELTRRLNEDFTVTAHDKHLSIHFAPQEAAMLHGRQSDERVEGAGAERMAQIRNYGLREMKVLEGNIRYLRVDGFVWTGPKTAHAYDTAVGFLQGGDAIVLDLRNNGGGSPQAVRYLISHFIEPGKPLVTFYTGGQPPEAFTSLGELPAGRMVGRPLYVLTSEHTASAAEEFAGHVAGYGLGELVGEKTAGAGFRNDMFPIAGKYVLSVSVARAVLASTGADWEGKGIAPTIVTKADQALEVAEMRAAAKLALTAGSDYEKRAYAGLAAMFKARIDPATPALPLPDYVGRFGEAKVMLKDGRLMAQGPDGQPRALLPLGQNLFALDGEALARIEFQVADRVPTELDILLPDGSRMKLARSPQ